MVCDVVVALTPEPLLHIRKQIVKSNGVKQSDQEARYSDSIKSSHPRFTLIALPSYTLLLYINCISELDRVVDPAISTNYV